MQKHTKLYLDYFDKHGKFLKCEVCSGVACDIHHIQRRGMGGSKKADRVENLIALCRKCHELYGDKKQYKEFLKKKHRNYEQSWTR